MPSICASSQPAGGEDLADQGEDAANVVAGGELRHHAAVLGVHLDLRVQGLGEQALARGGERAARAVGEPVQRDSGFVAGCLDA